MKYKKGETFYYISNGKVDKGFVIEDHDEPPIGISIFREKEDAEKMAKIINDAAWDIYTKVCVEETKECSND